MEIRQMASAIRVGTQSPLAASSARLPRTRFTRLSPLQTASASRQMSNSSKAPQRAPNPNPQDEDNANNKDQARQKSDRDFDPVELLLQDANSAPARRPTPASAARTFFEARNRVPGSSLVAGMNMPGSSSGGAGARPGATMPPTMAAQEPDTRPAPFRLGPTLGRSIEVGRGPGGDLARAMRQLETRLATNRVRNDSHRARFYERPGLRRKRLHSERWRRRFKLDFQATVSRVRELTRKGW